MIIIVTVTFEGHHHLSRDTLKNCQARVQIPGTRYLRGLQAVVAGLGRLWVYKLTMLTNIMTGLDNIDFDVLIPVACTPRATGHVGTVHCSISQRQAFNYPAIDQLTTQAFLGLFS